MTTFVLSTWRAWQSRLAWAIGMASIAGTAIADIGVVTPIDPGSPAAISIGVELPSEQRATAQAVALPTVELPLTGVRRVISDGAVSSFNGGQQLVGNLRILSDQTSLADVLNVRYTFESSTQRFVPSNIVRYADVGPYRIMDTLGLMARDTTAEPTATANGNAMRMDQRYALTSDANTSVLLDLTVGQVLSFQFIAPTDDLRVQLIDPYGQKRIDTLVAAGTSVVTGGSAVFATGTYRLRVTPRTASTVSFRFAFHNGNRTTLTRVENGASVSATLVSSFRDYAKFAIRLQKGQTLRLPATTFDGMALVLMDGRNGLASYRRQATMLYEAKRTELHYLFVFNEGAKGGRYDGTVAIR